MWSNLHDVGFTIVPTVFFIIFSLKLEEYITVPISFVWFLIPCCLFAPGLSIYSFVHRDMKLVIIDESVVPDFNISIKQSFNPDPKCNLETYQEMYKNISVSFK